jgi:hypothetical protein
VKGTDVLLAACDDLKSLGFDFDVRLVERVARREALQIYRNADIVVDQFCMGAYGLFALEAMALGKPVLCYLDHETLSEPVWNHPFVNTHQENIRRVLAVLLSSPTLRERLGRAGRASIERFDSVEASRCPFREIIQSAWTGRPLDVSECITFDASRRARSFCEDPGQSAFWPVPVDDLRAEMATALARAEAGVPADVSMEGR